MANKTTISRLTNANVYLSGGTLLGKAEEIELPTLKFKYAEHKALGLFATVELPSGLDKMEAKIKWTSFYEDVLTKTGNPFASVQMQLRANLETWDSQGRAAQVPVVCFLTVQTKELPLGMFKQHDNVELNQSLNVTYVKMTINGNELVEVDALSNIFKVGGVDQLKTYKDNTGA